MTTTLTAEAPSGTRLSRIGAVIRLHFTNPWTLIYLPWLILGGIIVLNVVIWWLLVSAAADIDARTQLRGGMRYSGAAAYFFIYMVVVAVQAINTYFPFALGYGVTRRNFYLGTALTFVALSAAYSLGLSALALIEEATGGWGFGGAIFNVDYFGDGPAQRLFIYFAAFLFFFFIGSAVAAVYVRWRTAGMAAFFIGLGFVLVGLGALVTLLNGWDEIGGWFAALGLVGSVTASLIPTCLAAIVGYLILRRATVRG